MMIHPAGPGARWHQYATSPGREVMLDLLVLAKELFWAVAAAERRRGSRSLLN